MTHLRTDLRYEVRCSFGVHPSRWTRFYPWALLLFWSTGSGCVRQIVDHRERTVSGWWFAPGDCRYTRE